MYVYEVTVQVDPSKHEVYKGKSVMSFDRLPTSKELVSALVASRARLAEASKLHRKERMSGERPQDRVKISRNWARMDEELRRFEDDLIRLARETDFFSQAKEAFAYDHAALTTAYDKDGRDAYVSVCRVKIIELGRRRER